MKLKNLLDRDENCYWGVFEVSDYESTLKIRKFNMTDQNVTITCIEAVSTLDDYFIEMKISNRGFSKSLITNRHSKLNFNLAELIWRTKM